MSEDDCTNQELRNIVRSLRLTVDVLRIDLSAIGKRLNSTQEELHRVKRDAAIGVLAQAGLWLISARLQPSDEWTQCPACQEQYRTHELLTHAHQCHTLLDHVRSHGPPRPPLIV